MTRPRKKCKRDSNPGSSALEADLTTRPTRRLVNTGQITKSRWLSTRRNKGVGEGWGGGGGGSDDSTSQTSEQSTADLVHRSEVKGLWCSAGRSLHVMTETANSCGEGSGEEEEGGGRVGAWGGGEGG